LNRNPQHDVKLLARLVNRNEFDLVVLREIMYLVTTECHRWHDKEVEDGRYRDVRRDGAQWSFLVLPRSERSV